MYVEASNQIRKYGYQKWGGESKISRVEAESAETGGQVRSQIEKIADLTLDGTDAPPGMLT